MELTNGKAVLTGCDPMFGAQVGREAARPDGLGFGYG